MIRVLHITNAYPYKKYSSYGIFIREQIDSLNKIGIENKVFFINARENGKLEYINRRKELLQTIDKFEPQVLHFHHEFSIIPLLKARINKPIIISLLGDITKRKYLNKLFYKILKNKADIIIKKNTENVDGLYRYVPNGVNLNFFKPLDKRHSKLKLGLDTKTNYVLFVSATVDNPIKRYDKFLSVIDKINDYGDQVEPLLMTNVSRDMVPLYFNSAEFLLVTSDHEGSPNAVKEAMACNLPIVSTDVGNVKTLFGKSKGNFLSNDGTTENLFDLSIKAIECQQSEGRERIINQGLDMKSVAIKIQCIYKKLLL